jgi:hypothetical protein
MGLGDDDDFDELEALSEMDHGPLRSPPPSLSHQSGGAGAGAATASSSAASSLPPTFEDDGDELIVPDSLKPKPKFASSTPDDAAANKPAAKK